LVTRAILWARPATETALGADPNKFTRSTRPRRRARSGQAGLEPLGPPRRPRDTRDAETALDHTWFRQYSSAQGRWLTPDPLAGSVFNPQSLNRYSYVVNSPTNLIDPLGLQEDGGPPELLCWFGGGGFSGIICELIFNSLFGAHRIGPPREPRDRDREKTAPPAPQQTQPAPPQTTAQQARDKIAAYNSCVNGGITAYNLGLSEKFLAGTLEGLSLHPTNTFSAGIALAATGAVAIAVVNTPTPDYPISAGGRITGSAGIFATVVAPGLFVAREGAQQILADEQAKLQRAVTDCARLLQ